MEVKSLEDKGQVQRVLQDFNRLECGDFLFALLTEIAVVTFQDFCLEVLLHGLKDILDVFHLDTD